MTTMRALTRTGRGVELIDAPVPQLTRPDDVLVRVCVVGLCRTDLLVAEGKLSAANPVILGHEFAGVVESVGPRAGVTVGDRVAVNPVFGCWDCPVCRTDPMNCPRRTMLGIDRDGALAEFVVVPGEHLVPVPPHVSDLAAAYAEPVAAALGVFNADIDHFDRGLIYGWNRFAGLLLAVLGDAEFQRPDVFDSRHSTAPPEEDAYDYVIETERGPGTLEAMMRAARPGGTVVLKSRAPGGVPIDLDAAVRKQLTIRGVNYGPFRTAVERLRHLSPELEKLCGSEYPLAEWRAAFAEARDERKKTFIRVGQPRQ